MHCSCVVRKHMCYVHLMVFELARILCCAPVDLVECLHFCSMGDSADANTLQMGAPGDDDEELGLSAEPEDGDSQCVNLHS